MEKNEQVNKRIQSDVPVNEETIALSEKLQKERAKTVEMERRLMEMEETFLYYRKSRLINLLDPKKLKQSLRNGAAYILGRRNLKRLYSPTFKQKQASNDLLPYVRLLYEEGFFDKALADLENLYKETANRYLKRALAFELMLYYANKETKQAANRALMYAKTLNDNKKDKASARQMTIIKAECLIRIGELTEAKTELFKQLAIDQHPDLFLALANTENELDSRIYWLNECLSAYGLQPIKLGNEQLTQNRLNYTSLHGTKVEAGEITGPKISVILPAYNAAESIHIAIDSILEQTWQNFELLIVDDCSTDNTYAVIETYVERDERIKLFQTKLNSGPYVARNIALRAATGKYVTVNDADDWSHPEKLAIQANHLENHPEIMANTSEQVRLTTNFSFHRRGTRGRYVFSNMSSLMFRRKEVMERIGYWDNVRFAADGEFKRRLIQAFGRKAVADLQTGPLSFPEQSPNSLTGSSAFGYSGYFMGARKEYVESFSNHHRQNELYYPFELEKRTFPVPKPMLPNREKGERKLDIIIVANFYDMPENREKAILAEINQHKQLGLKTGLVQLYDYNTVVRKRHFSNKIRDIIDGDAVQRVVFGETVRAECVLIHSPESLQEKQFYVPEINNRITLIVIDELPKVKYNGREEFVYNLRQIIRRSEEYFSGSLRIYPYDQTVRENLTKNYKRELGTIRLPVDNWQQADGTSLYEHRLKGWLVEEHDFKLT